MYTFSVIDIGVNSLCGFTKTGKAKITIQIFWPSNVRSVYYHILFFVICVVLQPNQLCT